MRHQLAVLRQQVARPPPSGLAAAHALAEAGLKPVGLKNSNRFQGRGRRSVDGVTSTLVVYESTFA